MLAGRGVFVWLEILLPFFFATTLIYVLWLVLYIESLSLNELVLRGIVCTLITICKTLNLT